MKKKKFKLPTPKQAIKTGLAIGITAYTIAKTKELLK
jgi:hypothetical protein